MLDRASDDVRVPSPRTAVRGSGKHCALEGVVAGLGAAAGENDVIRLGAQQLRYLGSCLVHGFMSRFAERMAARGIAGVVSQIGKHRLNHGGIERRGGVVIEVNGHFKSRWEIGLYLDQ